MGRRTGDGAEFKDGRMQGRHGEGWTGVGVWGGSRAHRRTARRQASTPAHARPRCANPDAHTSQGKYHDRAVWTETFVRKLAARSPNTALLYLELFPGDPFGPEIHMKDSDWRDKLLDGYNTAQDLHSEMLRYYGVPSASLRDALFPEMHKWRSQPHHEWNVEQWLAGHEADSCAPGQACPNLVIDHFHPNLEGHARIAQFVARHLLQVMVLPPGWANEVAGTDRIAADGRLPPAAVISDSEADALLQPPATILDFFCRALRVRLGIELMDASNAHSGSSRVELVRRLQAETRLDLHAQLREPDHGQHCIPLPDWDAGTSAARLSSVVH